MAPPRKHSENSIIQFIHENQPCALSTVYGHFNMRRQHAAVVLKRMVAAGKIELAFRKKVYRGHLAPFYKANPPDDRGREFDGLPLQTLLNSVWR